LFRESGKPGTTKKCNKNKIQLLKGKTMKTKVIKNALLLAVAGLALSTSAASAATVTWTDSIGSWFTCSNWGGTCPDSTTDAQINNGGTAQVSSANAVGHAHDLTLGVNTADSGKVSVTGASGGSLSISGSVYVAYRGTGTMTVSNGGSVGGAVATSGNLSIASLSGQLFVSNGSATVDGTGSTWTVSNEVDVGGTTSGAGGTGLLTVTNGGTVSAGTSVHVWNSGTLSGNGTVSVNSGSGTATVDGTLTPSGGKLTIDGELTFSVPPAAPTMECNVVPASADNVGVSGVASLAGKISVTMTGTTFTAGTRYTLLHADNGIDPNHPQFQFSSIKGGSGDCFTRTITYDTHNVYLYLQPCT
jgi:T5SS/PEP-CTERM-associated repeat protein